MIKIVAKSIIKDGMKEKFIEKARELVELSRKEKGCIAYNLYEDISNNKIMTFIEEWKDEEAIKIHNSSEHFTRIVPEFAELREGRSELNLYKPVLPE